MSEAKIKKMIAETFLEVADALETGRYGKKQSSASRAREASTARRTLTEPLSWQ